MATKKIPAFRMVPIEEGNYHLMTVKVVFIDESQETQIDDGDRYAKHDLQDFGFKVQADREKHEFYGWDFKPIGFYVNDHYPVTLEDAKRFAKVLGPLGKKVQKLNETFGYPRDFADHVARVAAALKIKLVIEHKPTNRADWHKLESYRQYDISVAVARIRQMEREWAEKHGKGTTSYVADLTNLLNDGAAA